MPTTQAAKNGPLTKRVCTYRTSSGHLLLSSATHLAKDYPSDHWCREVMPASAHAFVAVLEVATATRSGPPHTILVFVRDAAGYSTIVRLVDRKDPTSIYNQIPTAVELEAVALAATRVATAFLSLGIMPQLEMLGNNAHTSLPPKTGPGAPSALQLGSSNEPSFPHFHVTGRGDPSHCYIGDVKLRGMPVGEVMVPRQRHEAWGGPTECMTVATGLAKALAGLPPHPLVKITEAKLIPKREL